MESISNQFERTQILYDQGGVTKARFDEDQSAARQAAAELLATEAQLNQAQIQLSYTSVLSDLRPHPEEHLQRRCPGRHVERFARPDHQSRPDLRHLRRQRDDHAGGQAAPGRNGLDATFDAAAGLETFVVPRILLTDGGYYSENGEIDFVSATVDTRTGTIGIRAVFPNPNEILAPGQFVTVVIEDSEPTTAVIVPQVAVQQDKA